MRSLELKTIIFVSLFNSILSAKKISKGLLQETTKFDKFQCTFSDDGWNYFDKNSTCFVKTYSRDVTTLNLHILIKKPLNKIYVSIFLLRNFIFISNPLD